MFRKLLYLSLSKTVTSMPHPFMFEVFKGHPTGMPQHFQRHTTRFLDTIASKVFISTTNLKSDLMLLSDSILAIGPTVQYLPLAQAPSLPYLAQPFYTFPQS